MDDSINQNNYESYRKVFAGRKNPNNCPITGTFFVAHEYTNYQMVQQLHYDGEQQISQIRLATVFDNIALLFAGFAGHEIATYSVSHRKNFENLVYEDWVQEQIGMREILHNFANVSKVRFIYFQLLE